MFTDTVTLIDQTIENLQMLADAFAEDVDLCTRHPARLTTEARACREAAVAIDSLIPKLHAARATQEPERNYALCLDCD